MTIATDDVDRELVEKPRRWDIRFIRDFMVIFGLVSSVFDYLTFGMLLFILRATAEQFRTGWFVESLMTELFIALVVRTQRPFFKSKPGKYLLISTLLIVGVTVVIPYLPFAGLLGFTPLPIPLMLALGGITVLYIASSELAKRVFYKRVQL
jgi:Mg2+-importing ATPase